MDYNIWKVYVLQYFVFKTAFRFVSPFYIDAQYTHKMCFNTLKSRFWSKLLFGHLK